MRQQPDQTPPAIRRAAGATRMDRGGETPVQRVERLKRAADAAEQLQRGVPDEQREDYLAWLRAHEQAGILSDGRGKRKRGKP